MLPVFSPERFEARISQYQKAAEEKIEQPIESVQVLQRRLALTDHQRDSILTHLLQGNDFSQWGLANAVTRVSQGIEDYDEATDLEKLGGRVIELSGPDWRRIGKSSEATRGAVS